LRHRDSAQYRKIVQESAEIRSRKALERQPSHQTRTDVRKDIWSAGGDERLHFRLKSAGSELALIQKKGKIEAVEELRKIECWIQEKIDPLLNMSEVKALKAASGTYHYPASRFDAETVELFFYRLRSASEFPILEKPYLSGTARETTFSAAGKTPSFTARGLQAKLEPGGVPQ
jgi:hypothetical protein